MKTCSGEQMENENEYALAEHSISCSFHLLSTTAQHYCTPTTLVPGDPQRRLDSMWSGEKVRNAREERNNASPGTRTTRMDADGGADSLVGEGQEREKDSPARVKGSGWDHAREPWTKNDGCIRQTAGLQLIRQVSRRVLWQEATRVFGPDVQTNHQR
jgi:hypothetical protein